MPISDSRLREVFDRSAGQCQCRLPICDHKHRCQQQLQWDEYGQAWRELFLPLTDETEDLDNWIVLCQGCYDAWPTE